MCKYISTFSPFSAAQYILIRQIAYRYDFDRDGYITKEDVRLILSHIPIVNTVQETITEEGTFTKAGGGK